jgi:hypothetical protein
MTTILERQARDLWSRWSEWRGWSTCHGCGELRHCGRGYRCRRRLCIECFEHSPEGRRAARRLRISEAGQ